MQQRRTMQLCEHCFLQVATLQCRPMLPPHHCTARLSSWCMATSSLKKASLGTTFSGLESSASMSGLNSTQYTLQSNSEIHPDCNHFNCIYQTADQFGLTLCLLFYLLYSYRIQLEQTACCCDAACTRAALFTPCGIVFPERNLRTMHQCLGSAVHNNPHRRGRPRANLAFMHL